MMETAQTVINAIRVLLKLEKSDGLTTAELATALQVNRGVAQRIITTLHNRGAVTRSLSGKYWLGPFLLGISQHLPHELAVASEELITRLASRLQETVVVSVTDGDDTLIVARSHGSTGPLRVEYEVGFRQPLTRGASSLAILAHLEREKITHLVEPADLKALDTVREFGFARTDGHIRSGMAGIAVPIFADGTIAGSVAIIVPTVRAEGLESFTEDLKLLAKSIGHRYSEIYAATKPALEVAE